VTTAPVVAPATEGDGNLTAARRAWSTSLDPATRALLDDDAAAFIHQSLSTPCLDVLDSASGAELITASGRRILDFHGNSVHQVGHGHPRVVAAIKAQLDALPFSPRRFTNRPAIALAQRLAAVAPGDLGKVLFAPGGTSAIGMALKLARYATGRHKTLSMWDSFHGASLDAISVGGETLFRRGVGPLLPGAEHVPPFDQVARFFGDGPEGFARLADYIDYVLATEGDIGALVAEPVRWTRIVAPPTDFWPRVKASCVRHGALLVFDEIPSGLGRTGTMFACEQFGAVPDILVLGKGLGGGIMPLAAIVARPDLDVAPEGALGHYTHEKSPVAAAAALATLDIIAEERLVERAKALGQMGLERLRRIAEATGCLTEVRGLGLFFGAEVAGDDAGDAARRAEMILYAALDRGLSFKIGGGNVLTLCPPLNIPEEQLERAFDILEAAVRAAA
jgi:4-aminobutyrate aminotransferase